MTAFDLDFPNLRGLALPAKDLARGLRRTLGHSRRFAPVRDAVPEPLRDLARGVVAEIEGLAASARGAVGKMTPEPERRLGLAEIVEGRDAPLHFARAASHGLEVVLGRMGRDDLLVSATVAAMAYRSAAAGFDREAGLAGAAARLTLALAQHHAAGVAPGTPIGMGAEEARLSVLAGFAVMLWMMVPRDGARENEAALLALCADLTLSLRGDIDAAEADPVRLAALLATYADVV